MSSAPLARPVVALLPPTKTVKPMIDVSTEFIAVPASEAYDEIIKEAADKYEMDPHLIHAVMQAESAFHPYAVSRAGAEGLMQLMPELSDEMGVTDAFDPRENIMGGVRYLKRLLEYHDGNLDLALASYNAGPGNVERYGGVPPFRETRNYVDKVLQLSGLEPAPVPEPPPSPDLPEVTPEPADPAVPVDVPSDRSGS